MDWVWLSYNVKLKGEYIEHQRPPMIIKLFCFKKIKIVFAQEYDSESGRCPDTTQWACDSGPSLPEIRLEMRCESFANDSSTLLFEHLSIFITFSIWISWFDFWKCSGFPCFVDRPRLWRATRSHRASFRGGEKKTKNIEKIRQVRYEIYWKHVFKDVFWLLGKLHLQTQ